MFPAETFPPDLFGYWTLNDDLMFFGSYGNFNTLSVVDASRLNAYKFLTK
jgi:hypothetical protein